MQTIIIKEDAIALFGTQSALANALGITRQAVCQWPDREPIPQEHALRLKYEIKPKKGDN